ncbi:NOT2/NOT3/NOT5, C-terminal, partial [Dillenia turbinata]
SGFNGSTSNFPDSTGRSFSTSFSAQSGLTGPVLNHAGTLQGLHNMHGNLNIPNMPVTIASRNSMINGGHPSGMHQVSGNLPNGRFSLNGVPAGHPQLSHGHSGPTNRGGSGIAPGLGNAGSRVANSMINLIGGAHMGRSLSSVGGSMMSGYTSRLNFNHSGAAGDMNVHGSNRVLGGMLTQGPLTHNQVGNSQLNSMGFLNELSSNENTPFDLNDFPQLSGRPGSSSGSPGQLGLLRKQNAGVVQQNREFSIQNEDFPALPGFKGSDGEPPMDLHQKGPLHDNPVSVIQPQPMSMGRSGGFGYGGSYSSHHQLQHQHALSARSGASTASGLRALNSSNTMAEVGSYDQFVQQYQQLRSESQFGLQQMPGVGTYRDQDLKSRQAAPITADRFGLLGLSNIIRMSNPHLSSLALGFDLTSLGLNLNSPDDLHKTFASPWAEEPIKGDPEYTVPKCYYTDPSPPLNQAYFSKFAEPTLFYIFYSMPKDEAQLYAANELSARGWFYHREHRIWFTRIPDMEPLVKTNTYERGSYLCFDPNIWERVRKDNFVVHYDMIEQRPVMQH